MQRRRLLIGTACGAVAGAVVGALAPRLGLDKPANLSAVLFDNALLAHRQYMVAVIGWVVFSVY